MDVLTHEICGAATERETPTRPYDLRPEYCHYRDEGCEYAAACLDCPFPQCLYDEPRGKQKWLKELRDREIRRQHREGKSIGELAALYEVSVRTVRRTLKRDKEQGTGNRE